MPKPIKILHIFSRMNAGGAEIRTLEVMRQLDPAHFQMDYCALSGEQGILDDEIRAMGGEVHLCGLGRGFCGRFKKLLKDGDYDVVHSHVFAFSGFILRLAAQCKVPVRIAHFRSMGDCKEKQTLRRRIQHYLMRQLINRYATHILSVSKGAMDNAWNTSWQNDNRCSVIYNGIDLSRFIESSDNADVRRELGIPADAVLFIHVGRFDRSKNHIRLASIFARLRKVYPNSYLMLVGLGGNDLEQAMIEKIKSLGIERNVVFAGYRKDIPRLMKCANLMIFPSIYEGLPGSVLEACAAGVPVVASDLPGTLEIAERFAGVKCLSLSADDDVWVTQIQKILDFCNESQGQTIDQFKGSDFDMEKCVESLCAIWGTGC